MSVDKRLTSRDLLTLHAICEWVGKRKKPTSGLVDRCRALMPALEAATLKAAEAEGRSTHPPAPEGLCTLCLADSQPGHCAVCDLPLGDEESSS